MKDTQSQLLENFDEEVHDRLKLRLDEAEARLDKLGRWFWGVTRYALDEQARFDDPSYAFGLQQSPPGMTPPVASGRYQLIRGTAQPDMLAHAYRLSHPLGEWAMETGLAAPTPDASITFDYAAHVSKISVVENLVGQTGWLRLDRLQVTAFETTDTLLFSGLTDAGLPLDQETCEKLMAVEAQGQPKPVNDHRLKPVASDYG